MVALKGVLLATCLVVGGGQAWAGSAYQAGDVVDYFTKSGLGAARGICVGNAKQCPQQPVAKFDLLVTFGLNSDQLTPEAKQNLDEFAKALRDPRLSGRRFEIDGHTDARGSEDYNLGLSERRAEAVVSYLGGQGVDVSVLTPKGFGKSQPRVDDPFDPVNRRVETRIVAQP